MSSSTQLVEWAKQHGIKRFMGVFAADTLPVAVPLEPWSLIVNYQGHTEAGDHWVACIGGEGRAQYISSYGLAPDAADSILGDTTHFARWLNKIAPKGWDYNRVGMQSYAVSSDVCGQYSLWACKHRGGPTLRPEAWSWITSNRRQNDATIKRLVKLRHQ